MQQEVMYKTTWAMDAVYFVLNIVFMLSGGLISLEIKQYILFAVYFASVLFGFWLSRSINIDDQQSLFVINFPSFLASISFMVLEVALVTLQLSVGYYFLWGVLVKIGLSIIIDRVGKWFFKLCKVIAEFDYFDVNERKPNVFHPHSFSVFLKLTDKADLENNTTRLDRIVRINLTEGNFFIGAKERLLVVNKNEVAFYEPDRVDFIKAHAKFSERKIGYSAEEGWHELTSH